jgi:hypothetical protein
MSVVLIICGEEPRRAARVSRASPPLGSVMRPSKASKF